VDGEKKNAEQEELDFSDRQGVESKAMGNAMFLFLPGLLQWEILQGF
jgi:hypothetical protein